MVKKTKKNQISKKEGKERKEPKKNESFLDSILSAISSNLEVLNNSKYFTGAMLILLNLGTKYVPLELTKSQEKYLKYSISRQLLLFTILWVGTRDIVISLILTAVFIVLANYLFNENSKFCIMSDEYKELSSILDENGDGVVSEKEIDDALNILKIAKKQKNNNPINNDEELIRENFI
ncbi:MAG: hypothetical protein CBB97_24715 [Candidatus Endolissoclinum sp. TMED37]|nr:MAG: hypothetical protein CBB97_24715 [Candidatus Endolissoclinum sp. TMED37]|tara:strand:- start:2111 stop:2647 length:537 start_codon:yes stop_codon:yes gene_type:complete